MADEHDQWLDREAAESLLRGEPLEAVDADSRASADRLSAALSALTPVVPPDDRELRGEEAALAAFRKAREEQEDRARAAGGRARPHAQDPSEGVPLVRLGRPRPEGRRARWGRPVRFGMAAGLALGLLGGLVMAAGAGVLPTPFRDEHPLPAASASADPNLPEPRVPTAPARRGNSAQPSPGGTAGGPAPARPGATPDGPGGPDSDGSGEGTPARGRGWWREVISSCRAVRAGEELDSGRRNSLEDAAGDRHDVDRYCRDVLRGKRGDGRGGSGEGRRPGRSGEGGGPHSGGGGESGGTGGGHGHNGGNGGNGKNDGGGDRGERGGKNGKGGKGRGRSGGDGVSTRGNYHRGNGGTVTPVSGPDCPRTAPGHPHGRPAPSYSAL